MLVEHRVDNVDEWLIAVDEPVPSAQKVSFQPPFHRMLTEHLHDPTLRVQFATVGILRKILSQPNLLCDFVNGFEPVRLGFVWPKDTEAVHVQPHYFFKEFAKSGNVPGLTPTGLFEVDGELAEVRHIQRPTQK